LTVSTYSVSYSALGKNLAEANNAPGNYPAPPAGMSPGQVSALKNAVAAAITALGATDSFPVSAHASQLHNTTITVTASFNPSTHTISIVVG
jgi:hypothetical protein